MRERWTLGFVIVAGWGAAIVGPAGCSPTTVGSDRPPEPPPRTYKERDPQEILDFNAQRWGEPPPKAGSWGVKKEDSKEE